MQSQTHQEKITRVGCKRVAGNSQQLKRISSFSELPDEALISPSELMMLSGESRSTIRRNVRRGILPKPIRIGRAAKKWRVWIIRAYLGGSSQDG